LGVKTVILFQLFLSRFGDQNPFIIPNFTYFPTILQDICEFGLQNFDCLSEDAFAMILLGLGMQKRRLESYKYERCS